MVRTLKGANEQRPRKEKGGSLTCRIISFRPIIIKASKLDKILHPYTAHFTICAQ